MTRSKKGNKKQTSKNVELLITKYKYEIIDKVQKNRVVIIVGQTGSGKSTQVPQYLHENRDKIGLKPNGIIACLHPRSVAAMSLGKRVAKENRTPCGSTVGYSVRFYSKKSEETRIVYMTAGFMVRLLNNPKIIDQYAAIIVDEAHERSVQNDLIMGQMRLIMEKNKRVRLIIMSATMNVSEIERYYPQAAMVQISPVKDRVNIIYRPVKGSDYVANVVDVVMEILRDNKTGHILVFLPSEDKVWRCKQLLREAKAKVLPFYGAMDYNDRMSVFKDYRQRKVVVATNIAETSLTIVGVKFVIDAGYVKRVQYDHINRVERWVTERVSVAEAEQRKGRTGRTGDGTGTCYRLYDPFDYDKLKPRLEPWIGHLEMKYSIAQLRVVAENISAIEDIPEVDALQSVCDQIDALLSRLPPHKDAVCIRFPKPEMTTANMDQTVLNMATLNINIASFPFIAPPGPERLASAVTRLKNLSLFGDDNKPTRLGFDVSKLPLDPALGKVAVMASKQPCRDDVFAIIALLSSSSVFKRPSKSTRAAHSAFGREDGDLLTLLNVYEAAEENDFSLEWCTANGVIHHSLKFARLAVNQLSGLLPTNSNQGYSTRELFPPDIRMQSTKAAFLCAFFDNLSIPLTPSNKKVGQFGIYGEKTGTIYQHSCLSPLTQNYVMGLSLHSSVSSQQVIMKQCTVYDRDFLQHIDPRAWRIRANLWRDVLEFLSTPKKP